MDFRWIELEYKASAVVVSFKMPLTGRGFDCPRLRNELAELVRNEAHRTLVVDFGDYQLYPAEILGCLADVRQHLSSPEPIRCVNLPLRLEVACRFLQFHGSILETYSTLGEALFPLADSQETPVLTPEIMARPLTYAA